MEDRHSSANQAYVQLFWHQDHVSSCVPESEAGAVLCTVVLKRYRKILQCWHGAQVFVIAGHNVFKVLSIFLKL